MLGYISIGDILNNLREDTFFCWRALPTASKIAPCNCEALLDGEPVVAPLHPFSFKFVLTNIHMALNHVCQAVSRPFWHFTHITLFNPHNNPPIVPILRMRKEEKLSNWTSKWKAEIWAHAMLLTDSYSTSRQILGVTTWNSTCGLWQPAGS